MSALMHHNSVSWKWSVLGETALLLEPAASHPKLEQVHQFAESIKTARLPGIVDVVTAYRSLAVFFDSKTWTHERLVHTIESIPTHSPSKKESTLHEIRVDYEAGLDWERVITHTGLSKSEIIDRHTSPIYTVAMIGFLPGFLFLEGLDEALATPRLPNPRIRVPAGSVGIGAHQTGLYSLESPGGWNIIGRTTAVRFNAEVYPPIAIKAGDKVKFINLKETS